MEFIIQQSKAGHGFADGKVHVRIDRIDQSEYATIPRVGDTVTWPGYLPGMEVKHVEFNYQSISPTSKRVWLASVRVWV